MKSRTCKGNALSTGASACPYDRDMIECALLVKHGQKLPANLDGSALEEACHADAPARVYPIKTFVEHAQNGGEPQVSAVGYGPNKISGVNALTETYTLDEFIEALARTLSKTMNTEWDAYFVDRNNVIYGMDDGTDALAGYPMSSVYPTITPHPTSSNKSTLLVNFAFKNARSAFERANFEQLDFDVVTFVNGLVPVKFVKVGTNKYKVLEAIGGFDRTAEFGSTIAATPTAVLVGVSTGVSYDEAEEVITITGDAVPEFKKASALYTAGIKGIEQA